MNMPAAQDRLSAVCARPIKDPKLALLIKKWLAKIFELEISPIDDMGYIV